MTKTVITWALTVGSTARKIIRRFPSRPRRSRGRGWTRPVPELEVFEMGQIEMA